MKQTPRSAIAGFGGFVAASLFAAAASLPAQCTNPWPTVPGSTGVEGSVSDMLVFDPDGAGPIGERVLVAGSFQVAGSVFAQNLAVYDPATRTWSAFGPGPYPANLRLARDVNGDIYAGGTFTSIAGVAVSSVARWDGISWSALGTGVVGSVYGMAALPAGGVVLTGSLTAAGGFATAGIARWDGAAWSSLNSVALGSAGYTYLQAPVGMLNGDICAAVQRYTAPGLFAGVLRFDGTSWSQVGAGFTYQPSKLLVLPTGALLAGGQDGVSLWNGTTWSDLAAPFAQFVSDLCVLPNGLVVAAGRYSYNSVVRVATWDGLLWNTLGDFGVTSFWLTLADLAGGDLLAGGDFVGFGGANARSVARWNGANWAAASPGLAGFMQRLTVGPDGSVFLGAAYGEANEGLVYRWNGAAWSTIGGGFQGGGNSNLTCLYAAPSGSLVAGGQTGWGGTVPIVQRWTGAGTAWTTLATASSGVVRAAVELPNGDLVVGGQFQALSGFAANNVARFDGTTWWPLGNGLGQGVNSLVISPAGELLALTTTSVFRWNGSVWLQIGLSTAGLAMVVGADGAPIVARSFSGPEVLRWNGSVWAPLGNGPAGPVQSMAVLPNGDLVVGPLVDTNNPARPIERWNGSAWVPLGGAVDATVYAMANARNGDLLLGGNFTVANGVPRCRFARVSTSCPASVWSQSASCFSGGPTLAMNVLPWLGGTCRSTATNLSVSSLAVVVTGLTATSTLLGSVLPQAVYGCTLLVSPDVLSLAVPLAGRVQTQFPIPNVASLLSAPFRQQVVSVGLDASGAVIDARASNALVFQVGSF